MTPAPLAALLLAALLLPATADAAPRKAPPKPPAARSGPVVGAPSYGPRDEIRSFAAEVAARRGLESAWLVKHLAQARRIDTVQRLMMPAPAGTAKDWGAYRDRFVEPRRIAAGVVFWQANEAALQRAEARWGVPPEIVVAIVGVETFYGRMTGGFRVIDALATLSFDFPTGRKDRSAFFRSELEEFLVLCQREGLDPQVPKGSFAGAIGLAQFMPGSINRYAIDFDGDGHVDMAGSAADAIGSIAHYLAEFGWQPGMAVYHAVTPPPPGVGLSALLQPDIVPSFSTAQFAELGALLADAAQGHEGALALVMLENGGRPPTYVAGTQNFYTITRYNWSSYYALAVATLAEALKRAR
jgi:membrane-bound lytic murein transglycosylase B